MGEPILQVENLGVHFKTDDGLVKAVDGVSFSIERGETLGIVGESGSGKSVTNLAIMGLVPKPPGLIASGTAKFGDDDLLSLSESKLASIRGRRIAMIFQDPMTSLNPYLTVAQQLTEMTRLHLGHSRRQALEHAIAMLDRVGIPSPGERIFSYPHQFSGGMRQRVMIAMALSCSPDLLIADEPTTALDVTIQAQILDLMKEIQQDLGTAIILITHDLGVVASICDRVNVMYAGRFVEEATVDALFANPLHPYTLGLLESIPRIDSASDIELSPIEGQPPDLTELGEGCAFCERCRFAIERCESEHPPRIAAPHGGHIRCLVDVNAGATSQEAKT